MMRNISKDLYNISKIKTKGKCIIDGCERETQEKSHSISESILNYIKGDSELFQIQNICCPAGRARREKLPPIMIGLSMRRLIDTAQYRAGACAVRGKKSGWPGDCDMLGKAVG